MRYVVESKKNVEQAAKDLQSAAEKYHFGVLHIHDLRATLKKKGVEFPNECRIFEICNPEQAKKALTEDMGTNLALPCRISVWEEGGRTKIGMLNPSTLLGLLSHSPELTKIAKDVEDTTQAIINDAK